MQTNDSGHVAGGKQVADTSAHTATPPVIAWQHELRPYEVCSDELKQIWLAAKPEYVEHYTIPLCRSSAAQAAANQFFGEFYKNKYEALVVTNNDLVTSLNDLYTLIHDMGWTSPDDRYASITNAAAALRKAGVK